MAMLMNGNNEPLLERSRGGKRVAQRGMRATSRLESVVMNGTQAAAQGAEYVMGASLEILQGERSTLVAQKQVELEETIDKHDGLVREMFHMENFKNMLLYDPVVAKQDKTAVFREYKAKYDLVDNATPIAGPSRQTRGRANERRQFIKNSTISTSTSVSAQLPSKRKPKPKMAEKAELENLLISAARNYKGKGKEKGNDPDNAPDIAAQRSAETIKPPSVALDDDCASVVLVRPRLPPSTPRIISRSAKVRPHAIPEANYVDLSTPTNSRHDMNENISKSGLKRPPPIPVDILERAEKTPFVAPPETPTRCLPPPTLPAPTPCQPDESISTGPTRRSGRLKEPPIPKPSPKSNIKLKIRQPISELQSQSLINIPDPLPSPPKFNIKRIKLIVRRPPPTFTNPRQRPPPPRFNHSLTQFLDSYICIDDQHPYAESSALALEAQEEATIREKVERFRVEGRFIPGTEVLFGTIPPDTPYFPPKRTTRDIWDEVVDAVVAQAKTRPKKSLGRTVAAQVAGKVQAHFGAKESRRSKAKDSEERRLRNLAKSTMKLVTAQWKQAVHHIRLKQRQEYEEEERRLGREHLASILNQSGQLLETQQEDLARGDISRSRSGSIGDIEDNEDDEEEETDVDEDDDNNQTSSNPNSDDEANDSDDNEGGTLLLLGQSSKMRQSLTMSGVFTPGSVSSEPHEPDPSTSTQQLLGTSGNALTDLMMYAGSDSGTDIADAVQANVPPAPSDDRVLDIPDDTQSETDSLFSAHDSVTFDDDDINIPAEEKPISRSSSLFSEKSGLQSRYRARSRSHVRFVEAEDEEFGDEPARNGSRSRAESEAGEDSFDAPMSLDNDIGILEDSLRMDEEKHEEQEEAEKEPEDEQEQPSEVDLEAQIPEYLKPYAVAPVEWDPDAKITPPLLLRGVLRPYQQSGLEWLVSLHVNKLNGILADEMGLGKTIQTISLLAHLACDRGIWGPHLIIVPTSVILNWEMEFKKFLPGFKVLSYHGGTKRRKELRQGWNDKHHFNVCITSYALASRDAHIFKRKAWYYMVLDEAHMIKNFKSQRWNILLMFRSFRRLLLTGTPLQNNLTELWALLQFLMSGANFANLKEFGDWFSNPLEKAIELGNALDDDTLQTVSKLHTVLRPYLLRRLKCDVEKELPSKFEHLTLCPLSKRQRFLYDEFMQRAQTRDALDSGVYQKIANILMQLRKVCNHPDLFEVRPIVTSFSMTRSAIADYEIKELLVRRRLLDDEEESVNLNVVGLNFIDQQNTSLLSAVSTRFLDATSKLPHLSETLGEPPPIDTRTIAGYRKHSAYLKQANRFAHWSHIAYLNKVRCSKIPIYSEELLSVVRRMTTTILPFSNTDTRLNYMDRVYRINYAVKSYATRAQEMAPLIDHFAFVTPAVIAPDLSRVVLSGHEDIVMKQSFDLDQVLHQASVKLQIAFPDPSLLQWDCGKLQRLADLLREKKAGGHRILIFTQMTRILDILETFLNFHGYLYLRLDGATKIEDRQYITERFNADPRIFCFIASSRSGGVGINLTGADTVVFYDSDFNPQMDRQCEDRAHRIGQIRDVHIYRFVSQHTVEEAMLRKANQKRSLDDIVIQKGEFDWRALFNDESALTKALGDYEDMEDRHAAAVAAREEFSLVGQDEEDFADVEANRGVSTLVDVETGVDVDVTMAEGDDEDGEDDEDQGGTTVDYMVKFVDEDWDYFREWKI